MSHNNLTLDIKVSQRQKGNLKSSLTNFLMRQLQQLFRKAQWSFSYKNSKIKGQSMF
jgi:hypothetical protein